KWIKQWKYSPAIFLTHPGEQREAPEAGEIFVQKDLAATLRKLVAAERTALRAGKSRKDAIYAAYDRFYKGDIARELVRGVQEDGGLFTLQDLASWKVPHRRAAAHELQGDRGLQAPDLAARTGAAPGAQHARERRRE